MIARHHNSLLYQNIKWGYLAKYIDKLKSRKYKAFIQEFHLHSLQNYSVDFSLLVLSSYKYYFRGFHFELNSFELGYILYCACSMRCIDISFFYYYRNSLDLKLFKTVKRLVLQAHYFLISLSFQVYSNYLKYLCNAFYCSCYNFDNFFYQQDIGWQKYETALILDVNSLVNPASLLILFNKIYFDKDLVKCILKFLDISIFSKVLMRLMIKNNRLFLDKDKLLKRLQEVITLQLTYELSTLLSRFCDFQYIEFKIVVFDKNSEILLLYDRRLIEKVFYFLFRNGFLKKIAKDFRQSSLVNGILTRSSFYSMEPFVYPFYFISRPSLYSQFVLMKHVSLMIRQLDKQSLFVVNIRLNMLLILWLSQYKILAKRVLYLLDYLIDLKLRYHCTNYSYSNIRLFQKPSFCHTILGKKDYLYLSIYSKKYRKSYSLIKLIWGFYFKCHINLREAV